MPFMQTLLSWLLLLTVLAVSPVTCGFFTPTPPPFHGVHVCVQPQATNKPSADQLASNVALFYGIPTTSVRVLNSTATVVCLDFYDSTDAQSDEVLRARDAAVYFAAMPNDILSDFFGVASVEGTTANDQEPPQEVAQANGSSTAVPSITYQFSYLDDCTAFPGALQQAAQLTSRVRLITEKGCVTKGTGFAITLYLIPVVTATDSRIPSIVCAALSKVSLGFYTLTMGVKSRTASCVPASQKETATTSDDHILYHVVVGDAASPNGVTSIFDSVGFTQYEMAWRNTYPISSSTTVSLTAPDESPLMGCIMYAASTHFPHLPPAYLAMSILFFLFTGGAFFVQWRRRRVGKQRHAASPPHHHHRRAYHSIDESNSSGSSGDDDDNDSDNYAAPSQMLPERAKRAAVPAPAQNHPLTTPTRHTEQFGQDAGQPLRQHTQSDADTTAPVHFRDA